MRRSPDKARFSKAAKKMTRSRTLHGGGGVAAIVPVSRAALRGVAARVPRTYLAWDCATGNGQAAIGLAAHFARVVATDASPAQIASASQHERVTYHVAAAESCGLATASIDLVTVAQALHWFDLPAFFREARRVLAPGGVIAAWCYTLLESRPRRCDRARFYEETVGPYWPPERAGRHGLPDDRFPFEKRNLQPLAIEQDLTWISSAASADLGCAPRSCGARPGPGRAAIDQIEMLGGQGPVRARSRWPLATRAGVATRHHDVNDRRERVDCRRRE